MLTSKKANYGRRGEEIALTWRNGVFVVDAPEPGLVRCARTAKAERVFLDLLRLHAERGRRVNDKGGRTYAPSAFAAHPASEGVSQRAFRDAMEALLAAGRIEVREEGPPSRRVSFLWEARS
ncbi:hypothetical protein DWF04_004190 [Cereibacter sphaeroides f. sp. denitrificans]|nr:hypothetical protein DWF04_07940 [Cereibacter sphaeroides f. sp. denitrificans]